LHSIYLLDQSVNNQEFAKTAASIYMQNLNTCSLKSVSDFSIKGEKIIIPSRSAFMKEYTLFLPSHGGQIHKEVAILPLFEILGADKFLTLLSALLSERRILFVSDKVCNVSNAVLSCLAMLHPFKWHHIMIPILPSKLYDYASAPMPYIIGIRRNLLAKYKHGVSVYI
jgi:hypothetical protein